MGSVITKLLHPVGYLRIARDGTGSTLDFRAFTDSGRFNLGYSSVFHPPVNAGEPSTNEGVLASME